MYLGEVSGVAVNSKGHIFVFSRGNNIGPAYAAAAAQLLEFSPDGKFLREIGHNLYAWSFAHTVKIDPEDNIWVDRQGLGHGGEVRPRQDASSWCSAASRRRRTKNRPAQASQAAAAAGRRHVPPGHRHGLGFGRQQLYQRRLHQFARRQGDKNGEWLGSWGTPGSEPGQFMTPHSIAVDAQDNVYVADRGNRRIQVFDTTGKFCDGSSRSMCRTIRMPGRRSATSPTCRSRPARRKPWRRARLGRSASRRDHTRSSTARTPIPGGSTS